ncbi:MAG: hypothetical protein J6I86_10160 [Bacteroidaceae bacterium]|nr:hypothetical protein [Bacteroidaceae bacterium]
MKRAATLGLIFALFCAMNLRAEVYTIDFNRGTYNNYSNYTSLSKNIDVAAFCQRGADYISEYSADGCSYYDISNKRGCGVRIGAQKNSGTSFLLITLCSDIQSKIIEKVIIYASRGTTNTTAVMSVLTKDITQSISFEDMMEYNSSLPESSNYALPSISINNSVPKLQIKVNNPNYIILHRIDIVISEDNVALPAQNGETRYATFSSDKATFFPSDVTVSKVSVNDGHLVITALETQTGFGTTGCYVPANTGVLLSSSNENTSYYTLEGETLDALTDNMLKPASEAMTGSGKYYKLAYDDYDNRTGLGFYWGAENGGAFTCSSGTAYLYVPTSSSVKGYVLDDAADEDAIHIPAEFVDEMGDIYNIAGQRINKPSQGIYIRGGRKYVGK